MKRIRRPSPFWDIPEFYDGKCVHKLDAGEGWICYTLKNNSNVVHIDELEVRNSQRNKGWATSILNYFLKYTDNNKLYVQIISLSIRQ